MSILTAGGIVEYTKDYTRTGDGGSYESAEILGGGLDARFRRASDYEPTEPFKLVNLRALG